MTTDDGTLEELRAENAALRQALDTARGRFRAMRDVGRALTGELSIHALLKRIVSKVSELTDADRASLFLIDEDRGELWSIVAEGVEDGKLRLPQGTGIVGAVARTGVGLNLADVYADPRFDPSVDERTGYRTRSLLCMPLLDADGQPMGVVEALNKRGGEVFSVEDERLLEAVGHQMAIALTNTLLYKELKEQAGDLDAAREDLARRVSELDLLSALDHSLAGEIDLEGTLDVVVGRVGELTDADAVSVAILDEETGGARFRGAVAGKLTEVVDFVSPHERGIIGDAIVTREVTLTDDARADPRHDRELAEKLGLVPGPLLVVPVEHEDRILGAVQVMRAPGRPPFGEGDQRFLRLLAARVALALDAAQRRAQAQRDEQLKKIGTMLSGIVHDFKTPMTIIAGYVELMADCDDPEERRESSETILKQTDLMVSMTRELLQFARGETEMLLRKVYLQRFAKEVEEMMRAAVRGTELTFEVDLGFTGAIRADETRLKRAIANLVKNAKEAMRDGGGTKIVFGVRQVSDQVELRVEDDGPGIPLEIKSRIFENFATHGKADGTGLGLALVRKIVEDHGGEVRVESRPTEGATFRLRLPL
jgi:signal transduction histidine kinase